MSKRFEGKVILITGASSGIGKQTAIELAQEGASVVLAARRDEKLKEVVKAITDAGGKAEYVIADVTKDEDNKNMVAVTLEKFGKLDGVFLNAGVYGGSAFKDTSVDEYRKIFDTNVLSVSLGFKHILPELEKSGGSAVVTSSTVTRTIRQPFATSALYIASKAAVDKLVAYAQVQGGKKVRINSVLPGITETDMTSSFPKEMIASLAVAERGGATSEIAAAVKYLLSDEASFCYGTELVVDGGWALAK